MNTNTRYIVTYDINYYTICIHNYIAYLNTLMTYNDNLINNEVQEVISLLKYNDIK